MVFKEIYDNIPLSVLVKLREFGYSLIFLIPLMWFIFCIFAILMIVGTTVIVRWLFL